jgi:uncharacterized membrane protein
MPELSTSPQIGRPAPEGSGTARATAPAERLESVDLLRGLVMVLMALDHTRDFFHRGAFAGWDPLDLSRTTVALFFTRWITHFCAPVFIFLAGTGAYLSLGRGKDPASLSGFLFTRGLWLIVLELTWVRWFGWAFAINLHEHWFIVIWAIGWSMIVLAGLVHLPRGAVFGFGLVLILGHNACDGVAPESWGSAGWLWRVLHAGGQFEFAALPGVKFGAGYPLIPWVGVMAVGFSFGQVLKWEREQRRRWIFRLGLGLTIGFLLLRGSNLYGNPKAWSVPANPWLTPLAILDCHKYPPSLCYLLMTLGPALMLLAWLDRPLPALLRPFLVFGRVPLFYYLLHLPLIHGLAVLAHWLVLGRADWLYGSPAARPPPEAGFGLAATYAAWLLVILLLYPVCAKFAELKRRRRDAWLSYL